MHRSLFYDRLCLHVVALFMRFAHGEGLARQHAIKHDAAEQIVFGNVRQDEPHVARLCAKRLDHIRAVDIVDLRLAVLREVGALSAT